MRIVVAIGVPALAAAAMFAWGHSWDFGPSTDCAMGTYFLAALGWAIDGLLLALGLGAIAVIVLAVGVGGAPALALALGTFVLIGLFGQLGATLGAEAAGCPGDAERYLVPLVIAATISGAIAYGLVAIIRALLRRGDASAA